MNTPPLIEPDVLALPLGVWGDRLRALGLADLIDGLLDAADPLAPLGAQALYVAQPLLGLAIPGAVIGELAERLDAPGGMTWLRRCLGFEPHGKA